MVLSPEFHRASRLCHLLTYMSAQDLAGSPLMTSPSICYQNLILPELIWVSLSNKGGYPVSQWPGRARCLSVPDVLTHFPFTARDL